MDDDTIKKVVTYWLIAKEECNKHPNFSSIKAQISQEDQYRFDNYTKARVALEDLASTLKANNDKSRLGKLVQAYVEISRIAKDNPKNMIEHIITAEEAALIMWRLEDAEMDLAREVGFNLTSRDEVLQKAFPNLK